MEYEAMLLKKIHAADQTTDTNAPPAVATTAGVAPHLRHLADGRLALIQADHGGVTIRQIIQTRVLSLPASTAPRQSSPFLNMSVPWPTPPPPTLVTTMTALTCALALAHKLSAMHDLSLIMKSMRTNMVMIQPETGRVDLLVLTSASLHSKDDRVEADLNLANHSAAAWIYLAPEQSGKANRNIDARTDLYSLGVVMYELLAGHPPFQSGDKLELIHQHLARAPPAIIPRCMSVDSHPHLYPALSVASAITNKLLQKQAEDRYQSTAGLIHDLETVLAILKTEQTQQAQQATVSASSTASPAVFSPSALSSFEIGQLDLYSTFRISQRLYGRETEVQSLIRAYQRICTNTDVCSTMIANRPAPVVLPPMTQSGHARRSVTPQLCLISGYSGVGKTSLVDELHKHIVRQRGLFARGKFDPFKRDSSCLLQAFRQLVVQLFVTDALTWKVRLLRALGTSGQVLCEVIPELTRLIGAQPPVAKLDTADAANRFSMVFCQFASAIATQTSPLTLFIDDLQWADTGSLALLQLLFQQESAHLLIIGAYRDNEVDAVHPLTRLVAEAKETSMVSSVLTPMDDVQQERVTEIKLKPLALPHIVELLVDSFRCTEKDALLLAQLLAAKTQGNPFFINTLLRSFYDERLLTFSFHSAKWEWQLETMRWSSVQENVVDVLCKQMLTLTAESQSLLQYAACCGNAFTLNALSVVSQLPLHKLTLSLHEIHRAGLLICTQHLQDLVLLTVVPTLPAPTPRLLSSIVINFSHDRILIAAYKLIPLWALPAMHRRMAHELLTAYDTEEEAHRYARDITAHVNTGYLMEPAAIQEVDAGAGHAAAFASAAEATTQAWSALLAQSGLVDRIIGLELAAAAQARAACAYDIAIHFLTATIQLLCRKDAQNELVAVADPSADELSVAADPFPHVHPACWSASHATCIHVYTELAQCFFLSVNHADCQRCIEYALSQLTDAHERASFAVLHIHTLAQQSNFQGAIEVGLRYLEELGIDLLPATMSPELEAWLFDFPDISDESTFRQHPVLRLKRMEQTIEITVLGALQSVMFFLAEPRLVRVCLTIIDLSIRRGITAETAHAFVGIVMRGTGALQKCYSLGRTATLILDQLNDPSARAIRSRVDTVSAAGLFPWKKPLRECVLLIEAAFEEAMQLSNVDGTCHNAILNSELQVHSGIQLGPALVRLKQLYALLVKRKTKFPQAICRAWLELVETMAGVHVVRPSMPMPETQIPLLQMTLASTRGMLEFHLGRMAEAAASLRLAASFIEGVASLLQISNISYHKCLAVLQASQKGTLSVSADGITTVLPSDYDAAEVTRGLTEADALIAQMTEWADAAPMNYAHKLKLMQAERNRVAILSHFGCYHLMLCTSQLYAEAADGAERNQFHIEHAMSLELTGRFMVDCGQRKAGLMHLRQAYLVYADAQAVLKTDRLSAEFPEDNIHVASAPGPAPTATPLTSDFARSSTIESGPSTVDDGVALDALSVLKATSTFSTEKDQKKLLKRLMRIVLETAGATRGALVLEDQNCEWVVELSASVDRDEPSEDEQVAGLRVLANVPLGSAGSSALPVSVFNFVLGSVETVLLSGPHSRSEFNVFAADPYFESHSPHALLCMPLLKGGAVFGVLYLENDFHAEAFTSSHVQLLQLLCGQAALSIDNARLYSELSQHNARLEELVSDRTSELEERNNQLQTAKEVAEGATRIKADFISNMSHEIRTPMNAVLGIGRLLSDTQLTLEQQQYVSMINNSGNLLLTIINDVLDYSKIEAGQLKLHQSAHNVLDVAETAVMLCHDMAQTKGLSLAWDVDPSLPPNLQLDATRLQQILLNLLSNAIKFTKKGGLKMKVGGRLIPALAAADANSVQAHQQYRLEFSVIDTGIGISSTQLATLFRSFSQVQHVSGEYGGTGLGLVISKRLVEAMGGEFSVESCPGVGSTFSFHITSSVELPDRTSPTSTVHAWPSLAPGQIDGTSALSSTQLHALSDTDLLVLGSARLLWLGERTASAEGFLHLLEHYGARVHVCNNVTEAAEYIQANWPPGASTSAASHAVLVNLTLPGVTEAAFREQISSVMSVRTLFIYNKLQPPAAASSPSVIPLQRAHLYVGDRVSTPIPFTPVIPLLSDSPTTSALAGALDLSPLVFSATGSSISMSSLSSKSPPSSSSSSPQSSVPGSVWSMVRSLPRATTRALRGPFPQRVLLHELVSLFASDDLSSTSSSSSSCSHSNRSSISSNESDRTAEAADLPSAPPTKIVSIARQYPLRILLAEDNLINQKMMTMMMRKLGYELTIAANGQQVLDTLEREAAKGSKEFECILMDASMDVMDGMECTRRIRAEQLPHRTRPFIIAQTANVTEEYRQRCFQSGMDRFIPKPIRVEELTRCLRTAHAAHQVTPIPAASTY